MQTTDTCIHHIRDLGHPDASRRRQAAEALASGDERALYPLIKALLDENTGVQDAAMRSLISIGGELTAYMTLPLLRESAYLRNTAMIILRRIGAPAVPLLRSLLKDKDDDIRKFAIDLIADIRQCDYPQDIVRLLESDPNPNVRAAAAKTIGRLEYAQAAPRLYSALKDEEWVCIAALEALAALKDETSIEPISDLLNSASEAVRYTAVETLGDIGASAASGALLAHLAKTAGFEKTAVVKSLVQIGITPSMSEVADVLIDMFTTREWSEKLIALKGLAGLRECRAVRMIVDIAGSLDRSEPENDERLSLIKDALLNFGCEETVIGVLGDQGLRYRGKVIAIEVLGELRCAEAVPHLIRLMEGNLREVRRASAKALAEIPGEEATQALRDVIEDRDGNVRRAAVAALGRIGDKASFDPILSHIKVERYRDVLEEAVRSLFMIDPAALYARLGELGPPIKETIGKYARDEDILISLSRDPDRAVRLAGLCGLGNVRGERSVKRLSEAIADPEAELRKCAVMSLSRLASCYDEIRSALKDKDTWVRVAAVGALGDSGSRTMLEPLVPMLMDPEAPVVFSAIDAIARLGGNDAVTALGALRNHHNIEVRERARRALEGIA